MSKIFKILIIAILALLLAANLASACQIGWRSVAELKAEAQIVVIAKIISARHISSSFRGENYKYEITVEGIERGDMQPGLASVTYEYLKAHLRGQKRVCPLRNGSGIEYDLKHLQKYKLYLKSTSNPEILLARGEND